MAIIGHLLGICFFGALAAGGFFTTTQVLYWMGVATMFFISWGNYMNGSCSIEKLKNNKPLPKEIQEILPALREIDYDSKSVHTLFSNVVHAVIALQLLHAPILAAFIMIGAGLGILCLQKMKELIKYVENDSRYK